MFLFQIRSNPKKCNGLKNKNKNFVRVIFHQSQCGLCHGRPTLLDLILLFENAVASEDGEVAPLFRSVLVRGNVTREQLFEQNPALDNYVSNDVYENLTGVTFHDCFARCVQSTSCKSLFVKGSACQLLQSVYWSTSGLISSPGYQYWRGD